MPAMPGQQAVACNGLARRRIYENSMFIRQQLAALVEGGLNLQDFMIHCLRNCYGACTCNSRSRSRRGPLGPAQPQWRGVATQQCIAAATAAACVWIGARVRASQRPAHGQACIHDPTSLALPPLSLAAVVVMTARDEGSSFSIFSSLNGRGMDLSVVDKLKAEMLQVGVPTD